MRANEKPDRSEHRARARGLWERSKRASNCRNKKDGKERIVEEMRRPCQEHEKMERDGEKLVVTRTTHCADCKWRVQDQSFPPLIHRAIVLHCLLAFPQHEYITRHSDVAYCLWITGLPDNKGYFHKKTLIHFSSYLIRGRRKEALRS